MDICNRKKGRVITLGTTGQTKTSSMNFREKIHKIIAILKIENW
jgi:hypothetical protein